MLRRFERAGRLVVAVEAADEEAAAAATRAAMVAGADMIYQALLRSVPWSGRPDFLVRTEGSSAQGTWHDEVWHAEGARAARGPAAARAAFYSLLLETVQRVRPERFHPALGTGDHVTYRVEDFAARAAFERFVDRIMDRLARWPDLHVYHYAPHAASALRRLAGRHGTREAEVDRLLRGRVLVDLYRVVRQALRASTESYSLQALEVFYRPTARSAGVRDAGASIAADRRWRVARDADLSDAIRRYNEDDCRSLRSLRAWLERLRNEAGVGREARPAGGDPAPRVRSPRSMRARTIWPARFWHSRRRSGTLPNPRALGRVAPPGVTAGLAGVLSASGGDRGRTVRGYRGHRRPGTERYGGGGFPVPLRSESGAQAPGRRRGLGPGHAGPGRALGRMDPAAGVGILDLVPGAPAPRHIVAGGPVDDSVVAAAVARVAWSVSREGPGTRYRAVQRLLTRRPPRGEST